MEQKCYGADSTEKRLKMKRIPKSWMSSHPIAANANAKSDANRGPITFNVVLCAVEHRASRHLLCGALAKVSGAMGGIRPHDGALNRIDAGSGKKRERRDVGLRQLPADIDVPKRVGQ